MEKSKMTYAMAIDNALMVVTDKATREKLEALKESLARKNGSDRKPTKTQEENVGFKASIVKYMEVGKKYTATDIFKAVLPDYSTNKASALLRQLMSEGKVERLEEGRKVYFVKVDLADAEVSEQ